MPDVGWVFEKILEQEKWRRKECINMIASENVTSKWVDKAYCTDFMHRYAEGIPFERHYQGARIIDEIEDAANKFFAKKLGAKYADTRPVSGAIANMAVMRAFTKPGDIIASLPIPAGAHSSHTRHGVAGLLGLNTAKLGFIPEDFAIDVDFSVKLIEHVKPKIVLIGASLILFPFELEEISEAAKSVGAKLVYDAAHVFGLIFAGMFQQPLEEGADIITTSTHKTFPGPQGGLIIGNVDEKDWSKVQTAIFPKILSNHHLHRIPALLVAGYEMQEFGEEYAKQIIKNAKALAEHLYELGFDVVAEHRGFTESHQVVLDVSEIGGGRKVAETLEKANIIANKNLLPWDKLSWETVENPSGLRLGVQELTRWGMTEKDMEVLASLFERLLLKKENPEKVKKDVVEFRGEFQEVRYTWKSLDLRE